MKYALLFKDNIEPVLVSADEVKNGIYSRDEEFVDPDYEFKVTYVNGARNNGGPYFRLYYSYEEYKKLFPDRATRYEIVANMRKYQECKWHRLWKESVSDFCEIEKVIKDSSVKKWKSADAFYDKTQTSIEFQHSYIALDFEERNRFYSNLSIDIIWLYDLTKANVRRTDNGRIEILEDNSMGFFRISEKPDNLKNNRVYIQVKSGMIYRVKELLRVETNKDHQATIRYFIPTEIYTEEGFINALKTNEINCGKILKSINELWNNEYSSMVVKNAITGERICVNRGPDGSIYRCYKNDCISYVHLGDKSRKEYWLSHKNEKMKIWTLEHANIKC